jgi:hypothetical protein
MSERTPATDFSPSPDCPICHAKGFTCHGCRVKARKREVQQFAIAARQLAWNDCLGSDLRWLERDGVISAAELADLDARHKQLLQLCHAFATAAGKALGTDIETDWQAQGGGRVEIPQRDDDDGDDGEPLEGWPW